MITAHYCLWFVVAEVNGKTAIWSLAAVMSPLPDVVVVMSGHLHFTVAQVAVSGGGPPFTAAIVSQKDWFRRSHKAIHRGICQTSPA